MFLIARMRVHLPAAMIELRDRDTHFRLTGERCYCALHLQRSPTKIAPMIPDDEFLERIVAGVHAVADSEADVAWNQHINGRQFDVVVRFKRGPLSYFVLVEVKNKKRKATAEDLDAFVTKARDQNANKAVFVTAAGFQSGALEVAHRHGIDLFTITFPEDEFDLPENLHFQLNVEAENPTEIPYIKHTGREVINAFEQICLVYKSGARFEMPDEPSQMDYYLRTTLLKDGSSLDDVLRKAKHPRPIGLMLT